jgi:hypothetical protein
MYYGMYVLTDSRKKLYAEINPELSVGHKNFSQNFDLNMEITYRPINALNFTVAPSFSKNNNEMQYVATSDVSGNTRYVVAEINQTVARISLRVTYMFTPNVSLQYWGQPFGSSGKYSNYKIITDIGFQRIG